VTTRPWQTRVGILGCEFGAQAEFILRKDFFLAPIYSPPLWSSNRSFSHAGECGSRGAERTEGPQPSCRRLSKPLLLCLHGGPCTNRGWRRERERGGVTAAHVEGAWYRGAGAVRTLCSASAGSVPPTLTLSLSMYQVGAPPLVVVVLFPATPLQIQTCSGYSREKEGGGEGESFWSTGGALRGGMSDTRVCRPELEAKWRWKWGGLSSVEVGRPEGTTRCEGAG
jgi:hypothetical protein